jgi:DNA replication protein DnaC
MGLPGIGKAHLAPSLRYKACLQGIKTLFTTPMNPINDLPASLADYSFLKSMETFTLPVS